MNVERHLLRGKEAADMRDSAYLPLIGRVLLGLIFLMDAGLERADIIEAPRPLRKVAHQ